jgi:hypothetical protein
MLEASTQLAAWRNERGEVTVSRLGRRVVYLRLIGFADQPVARVIEQALQPMLAQNSTVACFWDLEKLVNYHSDVRVVSTQVLLSQRARLDSVHAFSTSKLVTMGVSVASLALGGLIQMHKTRALFEAALREATQRLGI